MIFSTLTSLFLAQAFAVPGSVPKPIYKCRVAVIADDLPNGFGEAFLEVPEQASESHGGKIFEKIFDSHKVSVMADGKWLGISWERNGAVVAEAISLIGPTPSKESRVLIAYFPGNPREQAQLDCSADRK